MTIQAALPRVKRRVYTDLPARRRCTGARTPKFRLAVMRRGAAPRNALPMALRCLIVDDSPHFLEAARALLEREGLVVVGMASTTAEALRLVQDLEPDVVLVDVNLGNESGFDLARRIDDETSLPASSVILISARAEDDLADLMPAAPAVAFLPKLRLSARAIREILGDTPDTDAS